MQFLQQTTATAWAERFFVDLLSVSQRAAEEDTAIGFGLAGFRRIGWGATFRALDTTEVLAAYRRARRRAIFLDWALSCRLRTTRRSSRIITNPIPPPAVQHCLQELASDPSNLMVISGQSARAWMRSLKGCMVPLLAAEHGSPHFPLGSFPGARRISSGSWQQLVEDFLDSSRGSRRRCQSSRRIRRARMAPRYRIKAPRWCGKLDDVDPEFASMQVKELHQHLISVLANHPLEVTTGMAISKCDRGGINKGAMLDHVISQLYPHSGGIDFVLCIGDDSADEYMFSALQARFGGAGLPQAPAIFTTVVGRKPSAAHYFLNDSDARCSNSARYSGTAQPMHLLQATAQATPHTEAHHSNFVMPPPPHTVAAGHTPRAPIGTVRWATCRGMRMCGAR